MWIVILDYAEYLSENKPINRFKIPIMRIVFT